jgi:hypothetical protein
MYRPFKTTVKFKSDDGREVRLRYLVSADNSIEAKCELERRFLNQEVFGYKIETIIPQPPRRRRYSTSQLAACSYWDRRSIRVCRSPSAITRECLAFDHLPFAGRTCASSARSCFPSPALRGV